MTQPTPEGMSEPKNVEGVPSQVGKRRPIREAAPSIPPEGMSERPEDVLAKVLGYHRDFMLDYTAYANEERDVEAIYQSNLAVLAQLVEKRDEYETNYRVAESARLRLISEVNMLRTERDDLLAGFNATVDNWNAAEARADRAEAALRRISKMDPMEDVFDPEPFEVARSYFADTPEDELRPVKPGGDV